MHPGTISGSLHGSLLSTPLLPRTRRILLRTFLSGSSGHFSHVMAPLAHLCIGTHNSVSRRLWPSRDATTRTPTRAWRGVVFCVLYACTACCLAVLDVVLHTSYGSLPS